MKTKHFFIPRFFLFTFFIFPALLNTASQAQSIEPDERILRVMTTYAVKVESALSSTHSRVFHQPKIAEKLAPRLSVHEREAEAPSSLERKAFDILNKLRADKGLRPLRWSNEMAQVARLHSQNMARNKFFSHQGRDGSTVSVRANSLGIRGWNSIGENIAFNKGFGKPVEMACQQWITSPGHRGNILNREWNESGIGAAIAPDGSYYFTQVFISR